MLIIYRLITVSFPCECEDIIVAVVGGINAVPQHTITLDVKGCALMVVPINAALQAGEELDDIVEGSLYIVVELIAPRTGMHDKDGAVKRRRVFMQFLLHIVEVRYCRHVIVLRGIGVEANELDTSGNERIVETVSKCRLPYLIARTEEVVVANKHNVRLVECLEDIVAPFKLAGGAGIGEVATVNNKVDAVVDIDGRYFILKLRMPQMRVTDKRHAQRIAVLELLFNDRDILRIEILPTRIMGVIRMHVKRPLVATDKEQCAEKQ